MPATTEIAPRLMLATLLLPGMVLAQRHPFELNAGTPEGALLQQALQETDDAKKIVLYEDYFGRYPKHEGAVYAYGLYVPLLLKAGQNDKVIDMAGKALAIDPLAAPIAYNALQACEAKRDHEGIKGWSLRTVESAKKVQALPKPTDEDDVEAWKREVDFANQVISRAEYSLYAAALQATDPKVAVDMFETLASRNAKSEYLGQMNSRYFVALLQSGQNAKATEFATQEAEAKRANEDMLLVLADTAMNAKDWAKSQQYAAAITSVLPAQAAPAGVDPAAWDNKKKSVLGRAYWISGVALGSESKWIETDKVLKEGLPYIELNKDLLPAAYFYLGLANYKLAEGPKGDKSRMPDARKFTSLCANMRSPLQVSAQKNLAAMPPAPAAPAKPGRKQ